MPGISLRNAEQARLEITRDQAVEVEKLYRSVYKDMRKQLKSMTAGGATTSLRKSQLRKLTESLKEAYNTLGPQLEGSITSAITDVSQAVVDANNSWLQSAGLKVKGAYAYVPQDIVTMLASGKLYSDGWTLSKAIWGESQQKAHEIDIIVAKGVAANKSSYEIAKDLEKYVNPGALKPWNWSKVYPGSSKKVDYNAQRLARTMVSHAYQQSLERVCSKNPFVDGYRWLDAHTDRTCQLCVDRATSDHFGMGPGVYPKGELPLDHPNGMCTFETHMTGDLNSISDRLADWANGKEDPELDKWYADMGGKSTSEGNAPAQAEGPNFQDMVDRIDQLLRNQDEDFLEMLSGEAEPWWKKQLTKDERVAIKTYTGNSYVWMNQALRTGTVDGLPEDRKKLVLDAMSGLKKFASSQDVVVRRGTYADAVFSMLGIEKGDKNIKWLGEHIDELRGSVASDPGFMSTSPYGSGGFNREVEFRILVPKGAPAPYVAQYSRFKKEKETLIAPGGTFRLVDIEASDLSAKVYLEFLGCD